MNTIEKYDDIKISMLPEKTRETLEKLKKATKDFTIQNDKADAYVSAVHSKLSKEKPDVLRSRDKKVEPKKTAPKKPTAKKVEPKKAEPKKVEPKKVEPTKAPIKKATKTQIKTVSARVNALKLAIDSDPLLKGLSQTDKERDASRLALPKGRRVSKKTGKVYYESRENRSDRKSPEYKSGYPYLAKGGNIHPMDKDGKYLVQIITIKDGKITDVAKKTYRDEDSALTYAMMKGNFLEEGQAIFVNDENDKVLYKKVSMRQRGYMADGGFMERGGMTGNKPTLKMGDAYLYRDETHYLVKRNGEIGLVSYAQGAWGSGGRFLPLQKMFRSDLEENLTDFKGNKLNIPSYDELMQQPYGFMEHGGKIGNDEVAEMLKGKYVNIFSMGVETPMSTDIIEAKMSDPTFRYQTLSLNTRGGGEERIEGKEKINKFLNGEMVFVRDSSEEYGIQLIDTFAKGGELDEGFADFDETHSKMAKGGVVQNIIGQSINIYENENSTPISAKIISAKMFNADSPSGILILITTDGRKIIESEYLEEFLNKDKVYLYNEQGEEYAISLKVGLIESLVGKNLKIYTSGKKEPVITKIVSAKMSDPKFSVKMLFLTTTQGEEIIEGEKRIENFLSNNMVMVYDSKGEEYGISLGMGNNYMAKGGLVQGDKLPHKLSKYFIKGAKTIEVPMDKLSPTRAREKGIENAEKYMRMAYNGEMDRRKPITVYGTTNGRYKVADGNSTYAVAKKNGWKTILADVIKNPSLQSNGQKSIFALAKEIRKEGESWQGAIQRAKKMKK